MEQWCGIVGAGLLCGSILTGNWIMFLLAVVLLVIWWINKGPGGP